MVLLRAISLLEAEPKQGGGKTWGKKPRVFVCVGFPPAGEGEGPDI